MKGGTGGRLTRHSLFLSHSTGQGNSFFLYLLLYCAGLTKLFPFSPLLLFHANHMLTGCMTFVIIHMLSCHCIVYIVWVRGE